jgi:hypothetical protein
MRLPWDMDICATSYALGSLQQLYLLELTVMLLIIWSYLKSLNSVHTAHILLNLGEGYLKLTSLT